MLNYMGVLLSIIDIWNHQMSTAQQSWNYLLRKIGISVEKHIKIYMYRDVHVISHMGGEMSCVK